jgi:malate synthase
VLEDGRKVTATLFREVLADEQTRLRGALGAYAYRVGHFDAAAGLLDRITTAAQFESFLTVPAYRALD